MDPEIQKYMQQQRLQNWLGSLAQGFMKAAGGGQGVGMGALQALAGANTGNVDPMDSLRMQAQMEQLAADREEQAKAAEQEAAQKEFLSHHLGTTFDPQTGMMWEQPGRAVPGSAGTTDIADLGPQTAGSAPPAYQGPREDVLLAQAYPEVMVKQILERQAGPKPQTPTGPMKDAVALGLEPGTPEYNEYIRERTLRAQTSVNVAAPDIGGAVGEINELMTASQKGQRAVDLEDRRIATTQMAAQGAGLIQALNEGGDSAISWTGSTARGLGKLSSQGRALAKQVGFDLNLEKFTFGGDLATKSSGIKSRLLGLAVGLTKADQGSRPSDFDVQTSLDRLAAGSGSSRTMAATVKTMLDEKMNDFAIDYRVRSGEEFDWDAELGRHGIEFPDMADPTDPLGIR